MTCIRLIHFKLLGMALGATLALAVPAAAVPIDVSLEPAADTVNVGDQFTLQLWLRSDPTDVEFDGAQVHLDWDPAYVQLDALIQDGPYAWMGAFFQGTDPSGGYATVVLFGQIPALGGAHPETDLHAVTLSFTALGATAGTLIDVAETIPDVGPPTRVSSSGGQDVTGTLSGANIQIVSEPTSLALLAAAGLMWLRRRRQVSG